MDFLLKKLYAGLPKIVGEKQADNPMDQEWTSAIFKQPVQGSIWISKTGLTGDGQADLENHGGLEKAVFGYSVENYTYWQKELETSHLTYGGMGENFLMEHVTESSIAIGDTFQIGDAVVQVSQPRQPCWKPARRFRIKTLALLIQNTGRTGWYFRVLKEGAAEAGQTFTLIDRPYSQWTIERCNEILYAKEPDISKMRELAACDLLAPKLKEKLEKRIESALAK